MKKFGRSLMLRAKTAAPAHAHAPLQSPDMSGVESRKANKLYLSAYIISLLYKVADFVKGS